MSLSGVMQSFTTNSLHNRALSFPNATYAPPKMSLLKQNRRRGDLHTPVAMGFLTAPRSVQCRKKKGPGLFPAPCRPRIRRPTPR
jgi:hypothetical protein